MISKCCLKKAGRKQLKISDNIYQSVLVCTGCGARCDGNVYTKGELEKTRHRRLQRLVLQ